MFLTSGSEFSRVSSLLSVIVRTRYMRNFKLTHGPVELEMPMGQTVLGHQPLSEKFGIVENHRSCLQ